MKKKHFKSLTLNKKVISSLKVNPEIIKGGGSDTQNFCCDSNYTDDCEPIKLPPINIPTIDIPTINDSCFSWCDDKCNDF